MSDRLLNKMVCYLWFSNLPYSNQLEYCQLYFNERTPEDLSDIDIVNIYNAEANKEDAKQFTADDLLEAFKLGQRNPHLTNYILNNLINSIKANSNGK